MKFVLAAACGLLVAACNQTAQTSEPVAVSAAPASLEPASPPRGAPASAMPSDAQIAAAAPLYEPLVDMHRVNPAKLKKDLLECRAQAAPQEAAARRAAQTQQTGTAIQVAGMMASYIPVPGFRQAHVLASATSAVQSVGADTAAGAAETQARAMEDYVLVVDACMGNRKYKLLKA